MHPIINDKSMIQYVTDGLGKYGDYIGAAGAIVGAHTLHIGGITLTLTHTLAHDLVTFINTGILAFAGVFFAEAARWCIKGIKRLIDKYYKHGNDTTTKS